MTPSAPKPLWNPYLSGALLGVVLFLSFLLAGSGLGGSGGLSRVVACVTDLAAPGYVDTNPALVEKAGGSASPLDNRYVWMALGVVLGGFISGLLHGRLKWSVARGPRIGSIVRLGFAFVGGALSGFGAALARGCTSGQALSGGAVLSAGSWAFMLAVFGAGYLFAYPVRGLWLARKEA